MSLIPRPERGAFALGLGYAAQAVGSYTRAAANQELIEFGTRTGRYAKDAIFKITEKGRQGLKEYNKGERRQRLRKQPIEEPTKAPALSGNMSNTSQVEDVPIVPHKRVSKAAPDYFTVALPYAAHIVINQTSGSDGENNLAQDSCPRFRMNTPVDVEFLGDPNTPLNSTPNWPNCQGWTTWSNIYQYYFVKEAHFKFTVLNNANDTDPRKNRRLVGLQWYDEGADQIAVSRNTKLSSKRSISKILLGLNDGAAANVTELQFSYSPESFQDHITTVKETNTVWTPIAEVPKLKRTLHFDACDLAGTNSPLNLDVILEVQYIVQFREPKPEIIKGPLPA